MADIVNLRQFRKNKSREDKADKAEENRNRHGVTKADKKKASLDRRLADKTLDGAKMERPDKED